MLIDISYSRSWNVAGAFHNGQPDSVEFICAWTGFARLVSPLPGEFLTAPA
jgi:hypothetical protein